MAAGVITALLTANLLLLAVSGNPFTYERDGRLNIINANDDILEATFYTSEMGIRIYSDNTSIQIVSMGNDQRLMGGMTTADGDSKLFTVLQKNFLEQTATDENGQRVKQSMVVPESELNQVKEDIEGRKDARLRARMRGQRGRGAEATQTLALMRLFTIREISLIVPAAEALGHAGILGYENQGALHFYAVAIGILKHQQPNDVEDDTGSGSGSDGGVQRYKRLLAAPRREKRWWWSRPTSAPTSPPTTPPTPRRVRCSRSRSTCDAGSCIQGRTSCTGKCTDWYHCRGRCGPRCGSCWKWACGTCCYHQGCYDHDLCCNSYWSWGCLIPLGFRCSGYSC